jgi:hypothetical protein
VWGHIRCQKIHAARPLLANVHHQVLFRSDRFHATYFGPQREGVAVFLLSGRKESVRLATEACLRMLGVTRWQESILHTPATQSLPDDAYKTKAHRY